jgi:hypothetical protein
MASCADAGNHGSPKGLGSVGAIGLARRNSTQIAIGFVSDRRWLMVEGRW